MTSFINLPVSDVASTREMKSDHAGAGRACHVSISGRFLRVARPTGTQRSARYWVEATLPYLKEAEVFIPECTRPAWAVHYRQTLPKYGPLDHLWEQFVFPLSASGTLWTLMGTGPVIHPGRRHVMVVHDLNFMIIPEVFSSAFRSWYAFACAHAARRADTVVVFTEYVKQTVVELLGVPESRVEVIPQGPGNLKVIETYQEPPKKPEDPFFLCVGSLQPHKNLNRVLQAWSSFNKKYPDFGLKVVGRPQARFSKFHLSESPSVEYTGYIDDGELADLYRQAHGFIYPSLEEGFGMPVVEAFYCGCPVITSNRSCLPEVAGDAALLIDPLQTEEIFSALCSLANSAEMREELRTRGMARANRFRWDLAGRRMAEVLKG